MTGHVPIIGVGGRVVLALIYACGASHMCKAACHPNDCLSKQVLCMMQSLLTVYAALKDVCGWCVARTRGFQQLGTTALPITHTTTPRAAVLY